MVRCLESLSQRPRRFWRQGRDLLRMFLRFDPNADREPDPEPESDTVGLRGREPPPPSRRRHRGSKPGSKWRQGQLAADKRFLWAQRGRAGIPHGTGSEFPSAYFPLSISAVYW